MSQPYPPAQRLQRDDTPLHQAVRSLVSAKDDLDAALRSPVLSPLLPAQLANAAASAISVSGFVHAVVPFLDHTKAEDRERARVLIDRLLGESWRWREPYKANPSAEELTRHLLDDARSHDGDPDLAIVFAVVPLGLFFAHEGKNRVQFLRSRGATDMPARITPLDYPDAHRLALYRLRVVDRIEHWCVLDRRWAQALPLAHLTERLLVAYGVAHPAAWPADLPAPDAAARAMLRLPPDDDHQPIDLDLLRQRLHAQATREDFTNASLGELAIAGMIRPRWRWIGAAGALLLAAYLLSLAVPSPWDQWLYIGATATLYGAWATLALPWVRTRRRHLDRQ
ncbi:hypothetical protein AVHY2522_14975 [Acidovorax sp. SUPP2522]|uniref:hypothetical protein n=1 Tax=unclassified Acidovorax TaxID=2684926 RepID=UPI00234A06C9|nr:MULTISPECIES: hypothetical protein [unclassified Acidovorax]WCM96088.1 hypothetical protein M5C96_16755 [Acidovorax sp. GBBC 1281]GKT17364.1 hypothetical protein AVHY2522_14975 [Acidovorax sp. SUPP2522]